MVTEYSCSMAHDWGACRWRMRDERQSKLRGNSDTAASLQISLEIPIAMGSPLQAVPAVPNARPHR